MAPAIHAPETPLESVLFQASVYLTAALVVVPVAARLGLGSVLGYLIAGILIGPVLHLVGNETADLQHFAEFGVVLMLFLVGLELEPRTLWSMRHKLVGLGGAQVALTLVVVAAAAIGLLGVERNTALVLGMMFALSSTAIVLQSLDERNLLESAGGRSTFAVLLMQDIAVIPILAVIPLLALPGFTAPAVEGHQAAQGMVGEVLAFARALPGWGTTLMTLAIVAAIILGGHYLTRPVFRYIHAARLRELSTFFALLIVMAIAFAMMLVGLSPALGTFLAGVVLANSEFRHQLEADIAPFKGILLGLFFITVGAGINFAVFQAQPFGILGMTLGLIALKGTVLYALARLFGLQGRDRWLFAFSLAQAGEFGFVVVSYALQQGAMVQAVADRVLLVISLSMLLTPLLFIGFERVSQRLAGVLGPDRAPDEISEQGNVIIAGIGRFGQVVNRLIRGAGVSTTVLDSDMEIIDVLRRFGVKGFYGDPTRPDLLEAAGLAKARVLVVAVDSREAALQIVTYARRARPDLHIVARAYDRVHVFELFAAGANDIVREMFDSSVRAGRYVLENTGFTEFEASELSQAYYHHDRNTLRELAELWEPGKPIEENQAYVQRAGELNRELETALIACRGQIVDPATPAPADATGGQPA